MYNGHSAAIDFGGEMTCGYTILEHQVKYILRLVARRIKRRCTSSDWIECQQNELKKHVPHLLRQLALSPGVHSPMIISILRKVDVVFAW